MNGISRRKNKLGVIISLIFAILLLRLVFAANATGNWHGLLISSIHLLVVALGSWFALRAAVTQDERLPTEDR